MKRVLFVGICLASCTILPVLLVLGGMALFVYALAAESWSVSEVADEMGRSAAQRTTSL